MKQIAVALLLCFCLNAPPSHADWAQTTTNAPVERLVTNLSARVANSPNDAQAHYTLARIHSMAYALGSDNVSIMETDDDTEMPQFAPYQSVRFPAKGREPNTQRLEHYQLGISHYRIATDLSSDQPLYWLGLAWMLDDGSQFAPRLGAPDGEILPSALDAEERARVNGLLATLGTGSADAGPAFDELRDQFTQVLAEIVAARQTAANTQRSEINRLMRVAWRDMAISAYRRAYELSLQQDLNKNAIGMEGDDAVSYEAGQALTRLMRSQPESTLLSQPAILLEIEQVETAVAQMDAKPKWITPVVFPINTAKPLYQLSDERRVVRFDMDGDGEAGLWPWVSADTGILVWSDQPSQPITSGRQLFGSVSWWTAWQNGYQVLASLDDNANGWLSGNELRGIAVWQDRNQNGQSDHGEVVPAASFGIARIAVTPDRTPHDGVPAIELGIYMKDGSVLPSYDWTPRRID